MIVIIRWIHITILNFIYNYLHYKFYKSWVRNGNQNIKCIHLAFIKILILIVRPKPQVGKKLYRTSENSNTCKWKLYNKIQLLNCWIDFDMNFLFLLEFEYFTVILLMMTSLCTYNYKDRRPLCNFWKNLHRDSNH